MKEPAYKRVYESIRSQIMEKKYDVGAILPPEPILEKEFGVSRTTVRRAIDLLSREGLLSVRQGFGTQVISRKTVQNLNRFTSVSQSLAQKGYRVGLRSCYIEKTGAPEDIADLLGIPMHTPVICIYRIKTIDDRPISITRNYILEQIVPDLDMTQQIPHLYDYLKETYGLQYTGCRDVISAYNASFEQAQLLGVEPKTALFRVRRVCYLNSRPCEVDIVDIIADLYEYEVAIGKGIG
ncbi:MAG: GntR family transcriptional regulator [Ruminococcaceae bacterium]|nr:GntR family transcriptional regulator [Oscillospiraceae bacterium]